MSVYGLHFNFFFYSLQKCHLAVIDTLMQAYSQHLLAVERVVKAVRYNILSIHSELPHEKVADTDTNK